MAKDTTGTRMTDEAQALRSVATRRVGVVFPVPMIRQIDDKVEGTEEKFAGWVREAVRQRLERES